MRLIIIFLLVLLVTPSKGQDNCPNNFGAWLWYLEQTGMESHWAVGDSLSGMGVKRIYIKVADGSVDSSWWPEIVNPAVPIAYHNNGMEAWAWSYNYPNNAQAQAEALYHAAKHGYDGYVIDVEIQFDGLTTELSDLFGAFYYARERAIEDGYIEEGTFPIYCSTWGNPADHNFHINKIDPWVDGYMPQTYVEIWGSSYVQNIEHWITIGNQEYEDLGATKPIHHICAAENGTISGERLDAFAKVAGSDFSIWRIPGSGVPESNWEEWKKIDWEFDYCEVTSTIDLSESMIQIVPNPAINSIRLSNIQNEGIVRIYDLSHQIYLEQNYNGEPIDISTLAKGIYILQWQNDHQTINQKTAIVKP